jgi:hypothetical protein
MGKWMEMKVHQPANNPDEEMKEESQKRLSVETSGAYGEEW